MKDPTEAYSKWRHEPTAENLATVVKALEPVYVSVLGREGAIADPYLRGKARVVAAEAVKSYNPELAGGASLATWTGHQMRQLGRAKRLQSQTTRLPERVQLDKWTVEKARADLSDELGRDPTVVELSDRTLLSRKRIADLAKLNFATPSESAFEGNVPSEQKPIYDEEALEWIYQESDPVDQKILEHTLGYGGAPILDNASLMAQLKLDPTAMTRRRQRLTYKLNDTMTLLEK